VSQQQPGILAVWNDCDRMREAEYEDWYRNEHLPERVGVPGFRFGRRYEAVGGASPRFCTYYEVDVPEVLVSPAYLERSNNPTPWTRKIMGEKIFRNASRTACQQVHRVGRLRGAYMLAARWSEAAAFANARTDLQTQAEKLIEAHLAVRAEIWQAVAEGTGTRSIEQGLRGGEDQSIAGAFIVEATRDRDLAEIARVLTPAIGDGAAVGGYRFLCALNHDQLD
jgi:hypothetical protein